MTASVLVTARVLVGLVLLISIVSKVRGRTAFTEFLGWYGGWR